MLMKLSPCDKIFAHDISTNMGYEDFAFLT